MTRSLNKERSRNAYINSLKGDYTTRIFKAPRPSMGEGFGVRANVAAKQRIDITEQLSGSMTEDHRRSGTRVDTSFNGQSGSRRRSPFVIPSRTLSIQQGHRSLRNWGNVRNRFPAPLKRPESSKLRQSTIRG